MLSLRAAISLGDRLRAIPSWQVTLGIALLGLGFLIAAQLASEAPRVRYTTQERSPLIETALTLQRQQEDLKTRILQLRDQIQAVEVAGQGANSTIRELNEQLEEARLAAGLIPLRGSGFVFQLDDSVQPPGPDGSDLDYLVGARDLRTLIEELWLAGGEAIAVNQERITPTTAIVDIGGSVLANSAYLTPPYQISVIGPPELYDRLTASEGFVDFVRARADGFGIRISYAAPETVDLPAFAGTVTLRHSRPLATPAASAAPSGEPGG
jgi:uncharacterized protein YlxW (UPF0749 family)